MIRQRNVPLLRDEMRPAVRQGLRQSAPDAQRNFVIGFTLPEHHRQGDLLVTKPPGAPLDGRVVHHPAGPLAEGFAGLIQQHLPDLRIGQGSLIARAKVGHRLLE